MQDDLGVGRLKWFAPRAHPRVRQQVVDQPLHAVGPIHGVGDELISIGIELALVQ